MGTDNPLLNAALDYARRGWAVFQVHGIVNGACTCSKGSTCEHAGKHPDNANGFKEASRNPDVIRKWWTTKPQRNIGVATGKVSGIFVVDVDDVKGGTAPFEALKKMVGPIDSNAEVKSGAGRHFYLAYPQGGAPIGSSNGFAGYKHVDVKADGGYIIAPPSRHASGSLYAWTRGPETVLPPVPAGFLTLIRTKNSGTKSSSDAAPSNSTVLSTIENLREGNRNSSFASLVGTMWSRGFDKATIQAMLGPMATQSGLNETEFLAVLDSVTSRYAPGSFYEGSRRARIEAESEWVEPEVTSLTDLMAREYPPQPWLVEPFLPERGITFVSGMEAQGKTWLSLDLCIHLATGTPWLGQFSTKKVNGVLIVDQESNQAFLQSRLRGMLAAKGLRPQDVNIVFAFSEQLRLLDQRAAQVIEQLLEKHKPGVLVFDSFIRAFAGDENSSMDVSRFMGRIKQLCRKHGVAVVLIDHLRKGNPSFSGNLMMRGSSDKAASADVVLTIYNDNGEISIDHTKARYSKREDTLVVELADGQNGSYIQFKGRRDAAARAQDEERVLDLLRAVLPPNESRSRAVLVEEAKRAGISAKALDQALESLVSRHRTLVREQAKKSGRGQAAHLYRWSDEVGSGVDPGEYGQRAVGHDSETAAVVQVFRDFTTRPSVERP